MGKRAEKSNTLARKGAKRRLIVFAAVIALTIVFGSGCVNAKAPSGPAPGPESGSALKGEILIAAAVSIQNALEGELIPMFNKKHPDIKVTGTYDSSGKLQTQIEYGLGAQLFFSASSRQMNALVEGGFIDAATVVDLLENEVVLVAGAGAKTTVTGFENITDAASIAIGDPGSVPAGQYAEEILTSLGSWDLVKARASHGTNTTEVTRWVSEGSAEVGIVFITDAANVKNKVRVIAVPPEGSLKTPVVYPVGLMTGLGDKAEAAQALIEFLKSPEALEVYEKYGFKAGPGARGSSGAGPAN